MSFQEEINDLRFRLEALEEFHKNKLCVQHLHEALTDVGEQLENCLKELYLPDDPIYHEMLNHLVKCTLAISKIIEPSFEVPDKDDHLELKQNTKFFGAKASKGKIV